MAEGWFDWLSGENRRAFADDANRWIEKQVRYYGGPHLSAALLGSQRNELGYGQPPRGGVVPAIGELSAGADIRDMKEGSGQLMHGLIDLQPKQALEGGALLTAAALGTMVPGSASGYRQAAEEATEGVQKSIRAYHGSPHDFDKFSMQKIGSGEGATAYGHGLYFAENERVAQSYRKSLSPGSGTSVKDTAARILEETGGDYDRAVTVANNRLNAWLSTPKANRVPDGYDRLMEVKRLLINRAPVAGRTYEVGIKADPNMFIDFDKPIAQQSKPVKEAMERVFGELKNPESTYIQAPDAKTAQALREAGVPGIKYYDQASRAESEGTRNFVVFDDNLIEIMRKYGVLPPLLAAGGGAALLGTSSSDAQANEPR